jgi:cyclopropane-fatty-acyl-phospholipid synthase
VTQLKPFFREVQAHYDLSDDFFALFLDTARVYSCAYFERPEMTLEEAQQAKIDLSLGKCDLRPGMRLLDIGCGWGAVSRRAAEKFGARVIGLTLSRNQRRYAAEACAGLPVEVRLQGWEEFGEPVDRIVSIGAFEHFRRERYPAFFERTHGLLPAGGRMLLHTIVLSDREELARQKIAIEHEHVLFAKFIGKTIFPGGQLCEPATILAEAIRAGFDVERVQSLRLHYARTLGEWAKRLEAAKERAVAVTSEETYETYMKYMTGCARNFRSGHIDVMQFTLVKK